MALNSTKHLNSILSKVTAKGMIDAGYPVFVQNTPVKSGNARRHTSKTSSEITANYPYAQRLDNGYSRQSPQGMVKPTIAAMRDYVKKQLGK
jgi:hypothetical protein